MGFHGKRSFPGLGTLVDARLTLKLVEYTLDMFEESIFGAFGALDFTLISRNHDNTTIQLFGHNV